MASTGVKAKDVHSGVVHKMGGRVKSWHKRWMILKSDHTLQYFKEPSKGVLGTINLRDDHFSIRVGEMGDANWPKNCQLENSLILITSGRTYCMFTDSLRESREWQRFIEESLERIRGASGVSATLPSRYNKDGAFDMPSAVDVSPSHFPKQYKKKERRLPTKRFNDDDPDGTDDNVDQEHQDMDKDMRTTSEIPTIEGVYDLATNSNSNSYLESNTNNNNGASSHEKDIDKLGATTLGGSACINESLYDLVGMINAGDDDDGDNAVSKSLDVYEPIDGEYKRTSSKSVSSTKSLNIQSLPLPQVPQAPKEQTNVQLYEDIPAASPVMYEDVERQDGINEADSSDEEDSNVPPLTITSVLPKIPPKNIYDSADDVLLVAGSPPSCDDIQEIEIYGNASILPLIPSSSSKTPTENVTVNKPPKPAPRVKVNTKVDYETEVQEETYDDVISVFKHNIIQDTKTNENDKEASSVTPPPVQTSVVKNSPPIVKRVNQTSPEKRIHSATIGPISASGVSMFYRKAHELTSPDEEVNTYRRIEIKSMILSNNDSVLTSEHKVVLAETLREVEIEKQQASEEKFKWERERLKLEQERRKFEEERQKLQEELAKTKAQLNTK